MEQQSGLSQGQTRADRQTTSYIAASHRKDRSAEAKAQSAQRASDKYKQNTGQELDINEEGEAVKPDYQQRSA
ncbi:hypothetical protein VTP01DRAFT_8378 [Rhizomucor pusillus]|uniref:uncharacterized protein n=1 Tax=Rhizomucor pusillus TaxID=4840 RepID=UPI00374418DB